MNLLIKISGGILLTAGFILAIRPDLFFRFPATIDGYVMIEKRVKWGFVIGFGGFMVFYNDWTSRGLTVIALLVSLTLGIIIARLIGFALDGFYIKQLYWLLMELAVLIIFGFFYWKQNY
ncbi:hypothetical protein [Dyadobacter psychrotolerans]|uniref:DUF4345 domain-containing protein n=1 Tax=Dyadobacter psychrotolerans TaxID=2541721 RepID=A0A4V2Z486_9BACT|nr:hypothetical protein [Dyadobacter psychrotolerans]TDE15638.1 hypothetical protein E0F88_14155 [Dyadobacter psychrotolerans]